MEIIDHNFKTIKAKVADMKLLGYVEHDNKYLFATEEYWVNSIGDHNKGITLYEYDGDVLDILDDEAVDASEEFTTEDIETVTSESLSLYDWPDHLIEDLKKQIYRSVNK
jgi:hypothetical protein